VYLKITEEMKWLRAIWRKETFSLRTGSPEERHNSSHCLAESERGLISLAYDLFIYLSLCDFLN